MSLWLTAMWDCRQPECLVTGERVTEPTLRSRYCGGPSCVLCRSCDRACGRSGQERPTGTSGRPGHVAAGAADPSTVMAWARRRRGGHGSSRPPMTPGGVSNGICMTARNSGLSRWDSGCSWQKSSVPPEQMALREQISDVVTGLGNVSDELREISRGIHPAILSKGGLARSQWRRGVTG